MSDRKSYYDSNKFSEVDLDSLLNKKRNNLFQFIKPSESSESTETERPNPLSYLISEAVASVNQICIDDPQDPIYQFSRRFSSVLLSEPKGIVDYAIKEGAAIGIYKGISVAVKRWKG